MMDAEQAVQLIDAVVYATMDYCSAWHRGLKGGKQARAKRAAVVALFAAATGRSPTEEELDRMSAATAACG